MTKPQLIGGTLLVPGRDPPQLLEAADQAPHLIAISVDVPIAVEVPALGDRRGLPARASVGLASRSVQTLGWSTRELVMKVAISG
jgi:hypothetical protein